MKSFIIILLLCVIGGSKLFAQKTEFIASAPSVVEVGEQFRLSFVLNNKGENLQVPTIKGFDLLAGPSLSTSSNITIINGDMKQNQEYTDRKKESLRSNRPRSPWMVKSISPSP